MANFLPLKNYLLYCIGKLVDQHQLSSPFLDVGCGIGDVAEYLARKGWAGKAIDISADALDQARIKLKHFPSIELTSQNLYELTGTYQTVFLMDILEHLPDDESALKKAAELTAKNGFVILAIPSNPAKEWRWDDDMYGHVRRYSEEDIRQKLTNCGLQPVLYWDFTFPVFWLMRQLQMKLTRNNTLSKKDLQSKTKLSGLRPPWQESFLSSFLSKLLILWKFIYIIQFRFFKTKIACGHEMIVLAQKV